MFAHILLTLALRAPLALYLVQSDDRSNVPVFVIVIIVLVLLLILLAAWTSSSGIKESEEEPETAAGHGLHEELSSEPEPEPEPAAAPVEPDDLKKIEGIGPKIQSILAEANITTFAQLAAASVADLERIVREEAGIRVAFPDTWPQQAKLAAAGDWERLEELQDKLKGGRVA